MKFSDRERRGWYSNRRYGLADINEIGMDLQDLNIKERMIMFTILETCRILQIKKHNKLSNTSLQKSYIKRNNIIDVLGKKL